MTVRTGPVVPEVVVYGILPAVDSAVRRTQGQQRPATAESGK